MSLGDPGATFFGDVLPEDKSWVHRERARHILADFVAYYGNLFPQVEIEGHIRELTRLEVEMLLAVAVIELSGHGSALAGEMGDGEAWEDAIDRRITFRRRMGDQPNEYDLMGAPELRVRLRDWQKLANERSEEIVRLRADVERLAREIELRT